MSEAVYKKVEIVGSSKTGIESAVQNAISQAGESIRNMRWFEVVETRGHIVNKRVDYWQVTVKIGFHVESSAGETREKVTEARGAEKQPQKKSKQNEGTFRCTVCGYVYDPAKGDPDGGIEPGTPFDKIPDDWRCPVCGVGKDKFVAQ